MKSCGAKKNTSQGCIKTEEHTRLNSAPAQISQTDSNWRCREELLQLMIKIPSVPVPLSGGRQRTWGWGESKLGKKGG